jgi:uncharacterized protein YecE (DUF72 family)
MAFHVTRQCARALQAKYILFQSPASFRPLEENVQNLRNFFLRCRPDDGMQFLWEPRGKWPSAMVRSLCDELNLIHVVDPFTQESVTSDFYYYRIHGKRGREFKFSDDEILELAKTVLLEDRTYILFNNMRMLEDARRLELVIRKLSQTSRSKRLVSLPSGPPS